MNKITLLVLAVGMLVGKVNAGNADRSGQAGASQLNVNPWARSSGWGSVNTASARGLEAMYLNVAGTAFTRKTEILFSNTNWLGLGQSAIHVNSFGFTQGVGETGTIGLSIMSFDFGKIPITTVDLPDGGSGTFSPQHFNMGLSYAKGFSDNIYGGVVLKVISESLSNIKNRGVALDAGIQYVTGESDNIKFGISLKNVGPKMKYSGDGLSIKGAVSSGTSMTMEQRSSPFELPSLLNIGGSYDFYLLKDSMALQLHRLTVAANFTSNSFTKDIYTLGFEYGFKSMFMVRTGYNYEKGSLQDGRTTAFTGPSAGLTVEVPFSKSKSTFAIDYSVRAANPFGWVNTIGVRINL